MAGKKFDKNDVEWDLYKDLWQMYQRNYIPEEREEFWENLRIELNEFATKYNTQFAVDLAVAVGNDIEKRWKDGKGLR